MNHKKMKHSLHRGWATGSLHSPRNHTASRALQADVDEYIRAGLRPRSLAERRVEREICYADHLKAIVEQGEKSRRATAGGVA